MTAIQFYHLLHTPLTHALPKLMERAIEANMHTVIVTESEAQMEQLNDALWSYSEHSFLPHGSAKDPYPEQQPIYITTEIENPNNASLLVLTAGQELAETMVSYDKVFDMFDGRDDTQVTHARGRWKAYKDAGHSLRYIQQTEQGSWVEKA